MEITVTQGTWAKAAGEILVVGLVQKAPIGNEAAALDRAIGGKIRSAIDASEFSGKWQQTLLLYTDGTIACRRVLLIGLGEQAAFTQDRLRQAASTAARRVRDAGAAQCVLPVGWGEVNGISPADVAQTMAEGLLLGLYRFEAYKTDREEEKFRACMLRVSKAEDPAAAESGARRGEIVAAAATYVRDLCNHPANIVTPTYLADEATRIAADHHLQVEVLERADMERLGMGALVGVAQGATTPPKLITLEYKGGDGPPVVLVGKSVTFDSGGISLKPADDMDRMKYDMTGGATVLATIRAAAQLKIPIHLIAVLPATDNMPAGNAIHPGDILTTLSGKTVEVINTDAEGRLCLADAITYSLRHKPRVLIDLATLTGACVVALGNHAAALFGNDADLMAALQAAGETTGERVWPLPLWDDYFSQIKSDIADLKNSGGRTGGAITAALFVKQFVGDTLWAHFDLAGVGWNTDTTRPDLAKGSTGFGVRLLISYLSDLARSKKPKRAASKTRRSTGR